jgi:lipid II:glycine glycyltransferase (peptidoglycan interpeptide bridge formation enzyme)
MNLIVLTEPGKKWDKFVSSHSHLIFHTGLWWKVLKEGYGCEMRYLVAEEGEQWLLALPGMMVGNGFFRVFYSLIPYGGFIGDRKHMPEFLNLVNQWAKDEKIQRIQIVDPAIKRREELTGFDCRESYRHVLELRGKSAEEIYANYPDTLKRNIKTALKSNLKVERIKTKEEADQFYQLYLSSMKRKAALVKYPRELFHKIYELLVPDFADILFVRHQNRPIAGIVMIYSKDTAHYFHGGSDSEYLNLRPNDLLFHQTIQIAFEKGKSYFDFLGSDKKFKSLIQFKDKWGTKREGLFNFHKDFGIFRPLVFKIALGLAQTSFGSMIHRTLKSIHREKTA